MNVAGQLHVEHVMGTVVTLDIRDRALSPGHMTAAVAAAVRVLHQVDRTFSTWRPESTLSRLRVGHAAPATDWADLDAVRLACHTAQRISDGWFDAWAMPGGFDPTGLVKGWAAQRAMEALTRHGVQHALVNAGGDLIVSGNADGTKHGVGWNVGITDPQRTDATLTAITISGVGLATSGAYERGDLAVDPHTGSVVRRLRSATIVAADLALADACATAALAHGPGALDWLQTAPGVQALLVTLTGQQLSTRNWPTPGPSRSPVPSAA